ncbi:hypothetical protein O6H91_15G030500 [Diphasiastrum complanatum]|uniref:Uncharacterized protein n=1 Tax=Diphasiastrum complanatum TaxID=34168 RepID=A0ACC2BGZ4_DIPCM|nr:hypothetical protein O6H91_15G030500 [Diphasiastrum complanatum]
MIGSRKNMTTPSMPFIVAIVNPVFLIHISILICTSLCNVQVDLHVDVSSVTTFSSYDSLSRSTTIETHGLPSFDRFHKSSKVLQKKVFRNTSSEALMISKAPTTFGSWRPPLLKMKTLGGKVLHKPIHICFIWYGLWPTKSKDVLRTAILSLTPTSPIEDFPNLSHWWNIVTQYYSDSFGARVNVSNVVILGGEVDDLYSQGKFIDPFGPDPLDIISRNLKLESQSGLHVLLTNEDAIYLLMISPDVTLTNDGFCGFHGFYCLNNWNVTQEKDCIDSTLLLYAVLPHPTPKDGTLNGCAVAPPPFIPPNYIVANDGSLDSMVNVMLHQVAEIATDPFGSSWIYSPNGASEIAHLCNYVFSGGDYWYCGLPDAYGSIASSNSCAHTNFGNLLRDKDTGVSYNMFGINGLKFVVQQLWSLSNDGCQLQNYGL